MLDKKWNIVFEFCLYHCSTINNKTDYWLKKHKQSIGVQFDHQAVASTCRPNYWRAILFLLFASSWLFNTRNSASQEASLWAAWERVRGQHPGCTRAMTCDSSRPQTWGLDDTEPSLCPHYRPSVSMWHRGRREWRRSVKIPAETMLQPASERKTLLFLLATALFCLISTPWPRGQPFCRWHGVPRPAFLKRRLEIYLRETLSAVTGLPGDLPFYPCWPLAPGVGSCCRWRHRDVCQVGEGSLFIVLKVGRRPRRGQP